MIEKLRSKTGLRTLAVVGLAGVGLVAVYAAAPSQVQWSDNENGISPVPAAPAPQQSRAAAPAAPTASPAGLTAPGVVRARDQAVLGSRITALITQMPFEVGQSFRQGQVLIAFDCNQMRAQLRAAEAATAAYRRTYDTNVELDRYEAIGTNDVGVSQANLQRASAEADAIRAGLGQCQIVAPFAGTVVERQAHRHDVAASGQPLMTIQRLGTLEVELNAPSRWLTWLEPGAAFSFVVEETGQTISGRVTRLGAAVNPVSKTVRVTGAVDQNDRVLPGMSGVARFPTPGRAAEAAANGQRS
jgi:RND family efflux transporter MFP subunit